MPAKCWQYGAEFHENRPIHPNRVFSGSCQAFNIAP